MLISDIREDVFTDDVMEYLLLREHNGYKKWKYLRTNY